MALKMIASEVLTLVGTTYMVSQSVGGRRALRNPWVWGALIVGSSSALLFIGAAFLVRHSHSDPSEYLGIGAFTILLCSLGWAWAAGMRRVAAVSRLLGLGEVEPIENVHSYVDPEDVAPSLTKEQLYALLALIEPTRGAPGYDWLTPDWVHKQLDQLTALPNDGGRQFRAGGA